MRTELVHPPALPFPLPSSSQVVLLGAVSSMFPPGSAPAGAAGAPGTAADSGSGWDQLGGLALTFLYLFVTSLVLGAATGMGISCLVVRFAAHGPHHVSLTPPAGRSPLPHTPRTRRCRAGVPRALVAAWEWSSARCGADAARRLLGGWLVRRRWL